MQIKLKKNMKNNSIKFDTDKMNLFKQTKTGQNNKINKNNQKHRI